VAADRVRRALIQAVELVSEHPTTAFGFVPPAPVNVICPNALAAAPTVAA
jgi:hypothetical protein